MKKIHSLFVIIAFFLFSNESIAQKLSPQQQQAVNKLFKTSAVVYFTFKVQSMQEMAQLKEIISVDKTKGPQVSAHANKAQFTKFIPMNYVYTVTSGGNPKKKTSKTAPAKTPVKKK